MVNMVCIQILIIPLFFFCIKYVLGCPPRIPPKAWSLFIVELISWIDCSLVEKLDKLKTEDDNLTEDFDERIRIVQTLRDMGNVRKNKFISLNVFCILFYIKDEYAKHNLERAIRYYAKGKQFLIKTKSIDERQTKQHKELSIKLYLNSGKYKIKFFIAFQIFVFKLNVILNYVIMNGQLKTVKKHYN